MKFITVFVMLVCMSSGEESKSMLRAVPMMAERRPMRTPYDNFRAEKTDSGFRFTDTVSGTVYEWKDPGVKVHASVQAEPLGATDGFHYRVTITNDPASKQPVVEVRMSALDWHDQFTAVFSNKIPPLGWTMSAVQPIWRGSLDPGKQAVFEFDASLAPEKLRLGVTAVPVRQQRQRWQEEIDRGVSPHLLTFSTQFVSYFIKFRVSDLLAH
jgi:hypothetical protein